VRESRLWALHLFAGAALLALLGLHMTVMHYQALLSLFGGAHEDVLAFASVLARDRLALMRGIYVLLLGFALYHGLYGARGVLAEIWSSPRAARLINAGVVIFGLAVFVYGLAVIVQAGRHAAMI
jgi:succinate dehydrogenase hydrophobic anchor subunit